MEVGAAVLADFNPVETAFLVEAAEIGQPLSPPDLDECLLIQVADRDQVVVIVTAKNHRSVPSDHHLGPEQPAGIAPPGGGSGKTLAGIIPRPVVEVGDGDTVHLVFPFFQILPSFVGVLGTFHETQENFGFFQAQCLFSLNQASDIGFHLLEIQPRPDFGVGFRRGGVKTDIDLSQSLTQEPVDIFFIEK